MLRSRPGAGARGGLGLALATLIVVACGTAAGAGSALASRTYEYDTPLLRSSPWPAMRRDRRNTGSSPIRARYDPRAEPWRFATGKGIFSTPVIDGHDTAYVPLELLQFRGSFDRSLTCAPTPRPTARSTARRCRTSAPC